MQWGRHKGLDGRYGKHVEPLPQWGNRWGRPCGSGTSTRLSPSSSSVRKYSEYPVNFHRNREYWDNFCRHMISSAHRINAPTINSGGIPSKLTRSFRKSAVRSLVSATTLLETAKLSRGSAIVAAACSVSHCPSDREIEWIWLDSVKKSRTKLDETDMNARLSNTSSAEETISAFGVPTTPNNTSAMSLRGPQRPWVQVDRRTVAVSLALLSGLWLLGAAILVYLLT
ncbi:Hypothetical protein NGAL_HAMBI2605_27150 [Neorhizobium galegae bv. orientalis]|nr:Hypothetical protein NGAL_HAMBI2605_27150 [Neorhizobium galegae bv. orientalis]